MKNRFLFGVIESIEGFVFSIFVILSYVCVNSRLMVFVFGIVSLLCLIALMAMFYISLSKGIFPIGITIAFAVLMFYSHSQYTIGLWTSSLTLIIIFVTILLSVVCVLIKYFQNKKQITIALKKSIGWIILAFSFTFVATPFFNYSLDLTEPLSIEYEIVAKDADTVGMIDQSTLVTEIRGTGYWYEITCLDQHKFLKISNVCINEDYHIEVGDHIYITYFQGVFFPIYQVDYDRISNTEIK